MLFSAQTASLIAGFFASLIQARWMEPAEMGRFAFCLSLILFASLFFEFGISSAGARVLALSRDRDSEREALGGLVLMTFAISLVFAVFMIVVAPSIDSIFHKDVKWLLVSTAALAFFQPFQLFIEQCCHGLNQIKRLSLFQLTMSGSYLLALIALVSAGQLTAGTALGAYLGGIGVSACWTLVRLRPKFSGASKFIKLTLKETRGYGFNLYLARISGMVSSRSDQLAIGYFLTETAPLGMYAVAQKFSNPIAMVGRSLAVTRFRAFARMSRVPQKITRWNTIVLLAAAVGLVALGPIALRLFFPKYASAAYLLIPFAVMNLFVGLFQPYNIFLSSHGRGVELRNIVLIVGSFSVLALIFTVPRYGITGAAWTGAAAMALDYALHYFFYHRVVETQNPGIKTASAMSPVRESSDGMTTTASGNAVVLDLSGDGAAALAWAKKQLPNSRVFEINKAELKWLPRSRALEKVRALEPDEFCIYVHDLNRLSGRRTMTLFGLLAGARRIKFGDSLGRNRSAGRFQAVLRDVPQLAIEYLVGYLLIIPLSWFLTEVLRFAVLFRAVIRQSRARASRADRVDRRSLNGLYIRASLSSINEGGASTHVAGFCSGAASLGHHIRFITTRSGQETSDSTSIEPSTMFAPDRSIFELWNNLYFTVASLRRITQGSATLDFIYQRYCRFNWTGVALSIVTGLPLVLEYNGSEVWIGKQWDPINRLWLLKRFERLNQFAADVVVVVAEAERRNLIDAGVDASRILVNPNGVDTDKFKPGCGGNKIRNENGLDQTLVVGFAGTFGPWHGAPVLAEAGRLIEHPQDYHFLFIGEGDERERTRSILEGSGLTATFTGRIEHDAVRDYLDACDILVSPHVPPNDGSEFFGSPTKLFEYMAMGKGIVASRLGQISDVIQDGENGLLVEPGSPQELARAIEKLGRAKPLRERLGRNAQRTVIESFTWKHNATRLFECLQALNDHGS